MDHEEPVYQYATTRDGVRIAFSRHGAGPPLVFVRGWIGQLDIFWSDPAYRRYFLELGKHFTVYRYDCRGNGLSGRETRDFSWTAMVSDLEAVVEHASLERFHMWGTTFGAAIAVRYAVRHPENISSLILDGVFTRGREITNRVRQILLVQSLKRFPEMAILLLASATNPGPQSAAFRRPETVQQMISPRTASKLYANAFKTDLTRDLRKLAVPTLIMHRQNSQSIPFRLGRAAADLVADARFVPLSGTAHNLWEEDMAAPLRETMAFLGIGDYAGPELPADAPAGDPGSEPPARKRRLAAVLHADVVGYTDKMEADEEGTHRRLVERLTALRQAVEDHGGTVHNEAGDALLAEFGSAADSIECAVEFQRISRELNEAEAPAKRFEFRIGVHLGDVISDRGTLYGTGVNIAQRLESECEPGGICISNAVYDAVHLIVPYSFEYCGERSFKNISFPVGTYAVPRDQLATAPRIH